MNIKDNLRKNIKETFGPGKYCLGKDWRINFEEDKLEEFIDQLSTDKIKFLNQLILFFWYHMRPLYSIQNTDDELNRVLGKTVWSTFSLITMMSVIDKYTKGNKYKREKFVSFLSRNLPIENKEDLELLSKKYDETKPSHSIKRLCDLFKENLDKEELENIKNNYLKEERRKGKVKKEIKNFDDVMKHLWGELRSGFIHDISIESIYNESTLFSIDEDDPKVIKVSNNLSMSNFLYLSWKAIFRDLGYEGNMNPNFTEKEKGDGITVEGTEIRF